MFGSDLILGTKEVFVSKTRVVLPNKMTGAEIGENVYLFYSPERDCVVVQSENRVKELAKNYKDADYGCKDSMFVIFGDYFLNCIGSSKVDCQSRITLGVDVCTKIGIKDSAFVVGCFDEVRIYASEEAYRDSLDVRKNAKIKRFI